MLRDSSAGALVRIALHGSGAAPRRGWRDDQGREDRAGTYHTSGGGTCYWAKLSSSDTFDILSNNLGSGPQTVTIDSPWFESDGCGTWAPS